MRFEIKSLKVGFTNPSSIVHSIKVLEDSIRLETTSTYFKSNVSPLAQEVDISSEEVGRKKPGPLLRENKVFFSSLTSLQLTVNEVTSDFAADCKSIDLDFVADLPLLCLEFVLVFAAFTTGVVIGVTAAIVGTGSPFVATKSPSLSSSSF